MTQRRVEPRDLPAILAINNDAVPAVNELALADLERFAEVAHTFLVVTAEADPGPDEEGDEVIAFLIGLGPGVDYDSSNYAWFSARFDEFIYVDRIVVSATTQSRGLGSQLYDAFAARGRATGAPRMLAEVNIVPRNDTSLAFHERHGFVSIGEQDTEGGAKRVTLLERSLD